VPCNEADAVRSARLYGKKWRLKLKKNWENNRVIILKRILRIAEKKLIIKTSPFFMNRSGLL